MRFTVGDRFNTNTSLWEASTDGKELHQLLAGWNNPSQECCGRWTPDGRYFVFQSIHNGRSSIWAMPEYTPFWRRKSSTPVELTSGPLNFGDPVPSRDGKKLFVEGYEPRAELVRYDSKSGEFLPYLSELSAREIDFSRDGKWAAYVSGAEQSLWRSKSDGSERLRLTYPPMHVTTPHWSPDGKRIVFSATVPGQAWHLFVIPVDGGNQVQLTQSTDDDLDPAFSPDGNTLVFGRFATEGVSLHLLDLQNNQLRTLSERLCCSRWSPDGRYIIALSEAGNKLMLLDVQHQEWHELAGNLGSLGYLTWSPDSKYLGFDTILTDDPGYFRISVPDGKLDRVASFKKTRRFWGRWGPWSGLAPDGSPLVVRDISTQEIYALDVDFP